MVNRAEHVEFAAYARSDPDARFRDWLRSGAEPYWTRMVSHRFTADMAGDSLPPGVLRRYLIYEHGFVETAVTIFGYALVKAPGIVEQARLVEVLRGLTTDQLAYFDRVFCQLGVSAEPPATTVRPPSVLAFCDGMLALAAHGSYEAVIASMAAAEWMYLTWCQTAQEKQPHDPVCADWIALHVGSPFADQVSWLLEQLDRLGPALPPDHQQRLAAAFSRTLVLEIAFHDAPYEEGFDE